MAILNKNAEKQTVDVSQTQVMQAGAEGAPVDLSLEEREMKISFPRFGRAIVSAVEFAAFAAIAGVCCWALSWVVTEFVALWV